MAAREGMDLAEALELGPSVAEWLSPARELPASDVGVATLALLSSRMEYWEVYSLAAAFVSTSGGGSADVVSRLAEGADRLPSTGPVLLDALGALRDTMWTEWSQAASFIEWCSVQPLEKVLSPPAVVFIAARDIHLTIPDSALNAADPSWATLARCAREYPDGGPEFLRCVEEHG